jgi:hypothetical protein
MERKPISAPRLLAPIALVAAGVIVIVVITLSFAETDDDGRDRGARQEQQATATTEASDDKYYVVESGDSFSTIAEKTGVPQETLEQLNPDLDPQALAPGQRIRLR